MKSGFRISLSKTASHIHVHWPIEFDALGLTERLRSRRKGRSLASTIGRRGKKKKERTHSKSVLSLALSSIAILMLRSSSFLSDLSRETWLLVQV